MEDIAERGNVPNCIQDAAVNELPSPFSSADGLVSYYLLGFDEPVTAILLVAHTTAAPRGFTLLCQSLGLRLVEAAVPLLTTALSRDSLREDLERAADQARRDTLTGLANRLAWNEAVSRVAVDGRPVSVVQLDCCALKQTNDAFGHHTGDRLLRTISHIVTSSVREPDLVARIGGDEFAILLPETDRMQALAALERARHIVAVRPFENIGHMTISAGICDLASATDADAMFRLADGALYWSKAHGRDIVWIYDPETVRELSAEERAQHLERGAALRGLRALARAIDAKDPTTRRHSDRVAALVTELAKASGWNAEQVGRLNEAALVHDVGKIGVPDAVLTKPGPLDAEEYEQIKQHAALSTQIVAEVLDDEQTWWVAAHHERPDGRGYPRGLTADAIPTGAALLAVADAWDVMTVSRPYSLPKAPAEALAECRELVGAQFTPEAIEALNVLHDIGSLWRLTPGVPA
jgi:diguanylate cyclase (GGDEF)-like protein